MTEEERAHFFKEKQRQEARIKQVDEPRDAIRVRRCFLIEFRSHSFLLHLLEVLA